MTTPVRTSRLLAAALLGAGLTPAAFGQLNLQWDGNAVTGGIQNATGNWTDANLWFDTGALSNASWVSAPTPSNALFDGNASPTITLGSNEAANNVSFTNVGGTFTVSGTGILTLNGALTKSNAGNATISSVITGAGTVSVSGGTLTLNGANTGLGGDKTVNSGGILQLGSNDGMGTGTLTLNGGSTLAASGANRTYANTLNVEVNGSFTIGGAFGTTINGVTDLNGNAVTITTNRDLDFGGAATNGSIAKNGTGQLRLSSASNSISGILQLQQGTLLNGGTNVLGSVSEIEASAGTAILTSGNQILRRADASDLPTLELLGGTTRLIGGGNFKLTVNSAVIGAGGIDATVTSSGATTGSRLELAGATANTFTGVTTVRSDSTHANNVLTQLRLGKTGGVNAIGGNLDIQRNGVARLLQPNQIIDTAAVTLNPASGVAALNLNSGASNVSDTIGSLAGNANALVGLGGNAAQGLTVAGGSSTTFGGVLTGSGSFTKSGAGNLTLTGVNRNTGTVTITAGTLLANGGLGAAATTSVSSTTNSSTSDDNFATVTVPSTVGLVPGQLVTAHVGGTIPAGTFILSIESATTLRLSNQITGTPSSVTFSAGSATGTGNVTVNGTGILGGTGSIAGAVDVQATGGIAPGASAGSLTLGGNLTVAGSYRWELADNTTAGPGVNFDQLLQTAGSSTFSGALVPSFIATATVPNLSNPFWQTTQSWTVVANTGGGAAAGLLGVDNTAWAAQGSFSTGLVDNDLVLTWTPIPEPGSLALLGLAGLLLAHKGRR